MATKVIPNSPCRFQNLKFEIENQSKEMKQKMFSFRRGMIEMIFLLNQKLGCQKERIQDTLKLTCKTNDTKESTSSHLTKLN